MTAGGAAVGGAAGGGGRHAGGGRGRRALPEKRQGGISAFSPLPSGRDGA